MAKAKQRGKPKKAAKSKKSKGKAKEPKTRDAGLGSKITALSKLSKAQEKKIAGLERKADALSKRNAVIMTALELREDSKNGDTGAIGRLGQSILKADEHILSMGKRMENMLSALKNHREYLIRLNKKVYRVDPMKKIEMELEIMNNTLSIMALSGFNIDKALFGDMKRINKMMEKDDADLVKVQKRMAGFKRKFEEEMEKFDFESIFKKADIPGYR